MAIEAIARSGTRVLSVESPIPETAKFFTAWFSHERNAFVCVFEHESFSPVADGALIPIGHGPVITDNSTPHVAVATDADPVFEGIVRDCCHQHWNSDSHKSPVFDFRPFITCQTCGNKRCPKATDCSLECTHSNDIGQPGSIFE